MFQVRSTLNLSVEHGVKVLVYGPAGVGKTRLMATAPVPFLISAEAGLLSLRGYDVPVVTINSLEELTQVYLWIRRSQEARQYHTIGLDSVSEIGEVCLAAAKAKVRDPRQAYGDLIDRMMQLMRDFRDLPGKHVYFSAKMEHYKDETTGLIRFQPSMPGRQIGPAMPYMFDEVFHMGIAQDAAGKKFRYLRTALDNQYEAKDRSGALDPFEPPDLSIIFNKIMQGGKP